MTDPARIARLVERSDTYNRLFQQRDYATAYDMLAEQYRSSGAAKDDDMEYARKMGKRVKVLDWHISRIRVSGNEAEVTDTVHVRVKEGFFKWVEGRVEEKSIWIFENGDWYRRTSPPRWDDSHAVEVPVPPPPKAEAHPNE